MNKTLKDLIRISNVTGMDSTLVQGGGGNTSAKTADGKYMYIKTSGTTLKEMTTDKGWRRLRMDSVLSILKDNSLNQMAPDLREDEMARRLLLSCDDNMPSHSRPSIETYLHAILDQYVIHLHPQVVSVYVNARNGKSQLEKLFKNEKLPPLWVPYTDSGFLLARKIYRLAADYRKTFGRDPAILFLDKHGLLVSAATADNGLSLVRKVIRICKTKLPSQKTGKIKTVDQGEINAAKLAIRGVIFAATGQYTTVGHSMNNTIATFLDRKDAAKLLAAGPLSAVEMIYANGPAMWLDRYDHDTIVNKFKKQLAEGCKPPAAFVIKKLGLFVVGNPRTTGTIENIVIGSMFVRSNAIRLGGLRTLTKRQQDFINKWEAQSYQQQLTGDTPAGDLKNRVAIVTGAGSGLGRSIAVGLARAGAMVGVFDIDTKTADQTVSIIKKELPNSCAITVYCNVTDETCVDDAFDALLSKWGGVDVLVNAAGVAPAYPLADLPVDKWRFALEVNLTGYFLMARAAARIMIRQKMGGSIINISSKTGIEASKDNTPYNATKAAELHMARGWAIELGQHNIRVNSVCPGNVFEGSQIWNPQYIKACARKYGINPDEVIPHYVNKTMLKREIKGQDIADAVVFLASDKARMITAQTLVADAGQAIVR
jgi:NAD(P)-dependent dehydrogenase (short-subunit alcohol dehydrogenase family)/rhamnose utilization protein RhaD (predicted bifunctional aldolase and dehydrogenase)